MNHTIDYVLNPEKTGGESMPYTFAVNCVLDTAYNDMRQTKRRWNRAGERWVQGYHLMQNFAPGETTPEQAQEIGRRLVEEFLQDGYEAVVATHVDKRHIHNHIVFNSVSHVDGSMFRSTIPAYINGIRKTSDRLCREYGLSVIDRPKGKGKSMAEVIAEQRDDPTIFGTIRADIDRILGQSYSLYNLFENLKDEGYVVRERGDTLSVQPPGFKKPVRIQRLGEGYTRADLIHKLAGVWEQGPPTSQTVITRKMHLRNPHKKPIRKITGITARYYRYMYLFGKVRRGDQPYIPYSEIVRFRSYQRQYEYLRNQSYQSYAEVKDRVDVLTGQVERLVAERKPLYRTRRKLESRDEDAGPVSEQIESCTSRLRELRRELRMCEAIIETNDRLSLVEQANAPALDGREKEKQRSEPNDEPIR